VKIIVMHFSSDKKLGGVRCRRAFAFQGVVHMKNLYFGKVSDFNITGNNLIIVCIDCTRYIIPISSVSSIKFNNNNYIISFNFPEKEWENYGLSAMSFNTSATIANKIINTIEKLKGEI